MSTTATKQLESPSTDNHFAVPHWGALRLLNYYRLALGSLWLILPPLGIGDSLLGSRNPTLFYTTTLLYLAFAGLSVLSIRQRRPAYEEQVYGQVLSDVVATVLLMHASGGPQTGLGVLLIIAVVEASLLMPGRMTLLFASLASLSILAQQLYSHYLDPTQGTSGYIQAGFIGIACFATALLGLALARRLRESEQLANRRGMDLANLTQLNQLIVERIDTGLLVVDEHGRIRLMNAAARKLAGLAPIGQPLENLSVNLSLFLNSPHGLRQTPANLRLDNQGPELLVSARPLNRAEGNGCLVSLEDASTLTERIQQEKLAALGQLTASIAHEVRNPLGAISHAAQLLAEAPDIDPRLRRLPEIIQAQSKRVNGIIETVLQLARREPSRPSRIALQPWLQEFVSEFIQRNGLPAEAITLHCTSPSPELDMDPRHLRQVLQNLCDNALAYGTGPDEPPRIEIHCACEPEPSLEVRDQGPGVAEDRVEQIFQPFYTSSHQGTGLGLYIARELCELNHAQLRYQPGHPGSRFRIHFVRTASI